MDEKKAKKKEIKVDETSIHLFSHAPAKQQ